MLRESSIGASPRRVVAVVVLAAAAASFAVQRANAGAAESGPRDGRRGIDVVTVQGYLDPSNAALIEDAVARANRRGSTLLILQVDSSGAIDTGTDAIVRAIDRSRVPSWSGSVRRAPTGRARPPCSSRQHTGRTSHRAQRRVRPIRCGSTNRTCRHAPKCPIASATSRPARARPQGARRLAAASFDADELARTGAIDGVRPTLGELIVRLDGKTVTTAAGPVKLDTAK